LYTTLATTRHVTSCVW